MGFEAITAEKYGSEVYILLTMRNDSQIMNLKFKNNLFIIQEN